MKLQVNYSGTPLIWPPLGQKKLAKRGGSIIEGFFYKKMYGGFCQVAVRRGSTVLLS